MEEPKVYWASVNYTYLESHPDFSKLKGGDVYVFLVAEDVIEVVSQIVEEFNTQALEVKSIEFVSIYLYKHEGWETPKEEKYYSGLADKAKKTNEIVFDEYYAYEQE